MHLLQLIPEIPLGSWASLGVGGVLAIVMFGFYRHDRKSSEDRYNAIAKDFKQIVQENTAASVRLAEVIDRIL